MTLKNWPKQEQPREKLLHKGAASLTDAELLAIFLRIGLQGKTAVDLARELLQQFNGLRNLLKTPWQQLIRYPGVGKVKYAQLQAALEMGRRYLAEPLAKKNIVTDPKLLQQYLVAKLRDQGQETFVALFLDNQYQLLGCEQLTQGTVNRAVIFPREVVKQCLLHNATAVIFAHNHPSGDAKPSAADIQITVELCQALSLIEIKVLDHFIVGENQVISCAKLGMLP